MCMFGVEVVRSRGHQEMREVQPGKGGRRKEIQRKEEGYRRQMRG